MKVKVFQISTSKIFILKNKKELIDFIYYLFKVNIPESMKIDNMLKIFSRDDFVIFKGDTYNEWKN